MGAKSQTLYEMYCTFERTAGTTEAQEWAVRNLDDHELKLLQRELDRNYENENQRVVSVFD